MTLPMTLIKLHSLNGQKGERMTHTTHFSMNPHDIHTSYHTRVFIIENRAQYSPFT